MRRYSLKSSLLILAILCVLPSAAISAWLLYSNFELRRSQAEHSTTLLARQVGADLDSELSAIEAALKVLAAAPELQTRDLAGFHERASRALVAGTVYNYILTDRSGQQVVNTLRPFGAPLPTRGTPAQLERVFSQGQTVLTDVFMGPVTQKLAIAMGVPVWVNGEVTYSLNIGLSPDRLNELLRRQHLPEGWLIAILDRSGTIAGRSREADRYVGEKAVPELREALALQTETQLRSRTKEGNAAFAALKPLTRWQWTVVVGLHESTLYAGSQSMVMRVLLGTALALGASLLLALGLARRVLGTMRDINDAAKALSSGEPFQAPAVQFREAEALGDALRQASQAMALVTFQSQHDALTQLPNRTMFKEFAERHLGLAQRNQHNMALIAIDLDYFKAVNDQQGHAVGDAVLIEAAHRIKETVRGSDIAARLGGDEFVVLLIDTDPSQALHTADRIVEALGLPYPMAAHPVTGSAGVALYPRDGATLDTLLAAADRALYAAKSAGRARVFRFDQLDAEASGRSPQTAGWD